MSRLEKRKMIIRTESDCNWGSSNQFLETVTQVSSADVSYRIFLHGIDLLLPPSFITFQLSLLIIEMFDPGGKDCF